MVKFHLLEKNGIFHCNGEGIYLNGSPNPRISIFLALVAVMNYRVIKSSTGEITITPELVVPVLPDSFITEIT